MTRYAPVVYPGIICGLGLSYLFYSIVGVIPGIVLAGDTHCLDKCLPSQIGKLWVMILNRLWRLREFKRMKADLCQLASMSGNNSVMFCSSIQTRPLSVASQQRTSINLHGIELGFGAGRCDTTSLSCEALLQQHRVDIYLSSQEEKSMKICTRYFF